METNEQVDFWLRSGWTSAATVISIFTVITGMWLGTVTGETPSDEKERVKAFFGDLQNPFERDPEAAIRISPFRIIGLLLAMFGGVMIAVSILIAIFYYDMVAFRLDLTVGVLMVILGGVMRWSSSMNSE